MHRVDSKKRQKLILRIVSYSALILLTVITSALLLYAALGYRLGRGGEVIRSGLLLVDAKPVAAEVYINGENKNDPTASRFVLPVGSYRVALKHAGYRDWSRTVRLSASGVENLYYPLLIPEKLTATKQLSLAAPEVVSQSPDKKQIFLYSKTAANPQLITLDADTSEIRALTLPTDFQRQSGGLGELKAVEWARDNRHVLVQQQVNGTTRWLSIDTKNSLNSIDIIKIIGGKSISDPHYATKAADRVYGLTKGVLYSFTLASPATTQLLSDVKSYEPSSDDALSFVRYNKAKQVLEAGVLQKSAVTVVHTKKTKDAEASGISRYVSFDDVYYLVVQLAGEKKVTLYQNPLKEPVLTPQLPLASIPFGASSPFQISANSQFVLLQHGQTVAVYDFEHASTAKFQLAKGAGVPEWLDSHRLLVKQADGVVDLSDFDGTNRYELTKTDYGTVFFADDYKTSFTFNKAGGAAVLNAFPMVVKD